MFKWKEGRKEGLICDVSFRGSEKDAALLG
jgi:hypothetical protein